MHRIPFLAVFATVAPIHWFTHGIPLEVNINACVPRMRHVTCRDWIGR